MNVDNRFRLLIGLALMGTTAAAGCGDDTKCGPGTVKMDGACVPTDEVCADGTVFNPDTHTCDPDTSTTCGDGTILVDGTCVGTLDCAAGTTQVGDECVPDGSVICTGNTMFDMDSGTCVPDPDAICEGDLVFVTETSTCVDPDSLLEGMADVLELAEPNDPAFNDGAMAQVVDIADGDGTFYGCVEPMDFDDDGVIDSDFDYFQITVDAPTLLNVRADGINGLSAAIQVLGTDGDLVDQGWTRLLLDLSGDDAEGKIFLPTAGDYFIVAADSRSLYTGEPAGGTGQCYFVQLATEAPPMPTAITPGTPVTGSFGDPMFYELTSTEGQLLFAELSELDADGAVADAGAVQGSFVVTVDGAFRTNATTDNSGAANGAAPGLGDGSTVWFVVDSVFNFSLTDVDYRLELSDSEAEAMPADGTVTLTHSDEFARFLYFDATEGDVVRIQMTAADPIRIDVINQEFNRADTLCTGCSNLDEYVAISRTGTHYVRLFNTDGAITDGDTYDLTFTRTHITPTALMRDTAASADLSANDRAFFTADLSTADWARFGVLNLMNLTEVEFRLYPAGEFGVLDDSLTPEDGDSAMDGAPFERLYFGEGKPFLISVSDVAGHDGDETFDVIVGEVPFTDLGTVMPGMDVMRAGETVPADDSVRYVLNAEPFSRITIDMTNLDGVVDGGLATLDREANPVDIANDNGLGGAEQLVVVVPDSGRLVFAARDMASTGGTYDLGVSAEPPPYSVAPSMVDFTSVCPSQGGTGTATLAGEDDEISSAFDLTAGTPFPFSFFGNTVTEFTISSNGWLTFEPGYMGSSSLAPSQANVIAPFATDLVMDEVCTFRDADTYTIEFRGATYDFFGAGVPVEMQVVLHTSGRIDFVYGSGHQKELEPGDFVGLINDDASIRMGLSDLAPAPTSVTWTPAP